jgi:hypothetical protein
MVTLTHSTHWLSSSPESLSSSLRVWSKVDTSRQLPSIEKLTLVTGPTHNKRRYLLTTVMSEETVKD